MLLDERSAELIPITWQLAAAFGQGAGRMIVTREAARAMMDQYEPGLKRIKSWEDVALQTIEFMRALGAASAMRSLQRGGAIIDTQDVRAAMGKLEARQPAPLGECPICLSHPR